MKRITFLFLTILIVISQCAQAQCDTLFKYAQTQWNGKQYLNAVNTLLQVKICDEKLVQRANTQILSYFKEIETKMNQVGDANVRLNKTLTELDTKKKEQDQLLASLREQEKQTRDALEKAQLSEAAVQKANRNFRNGLAIFFHYITQTTHTADFTSWATEQQHLDSLREVLYLMVDNSPAIRKDGPEKAQKWKEIIPRMAPQDMAGLFAILGSEASKEQAVQAPKEDKDWKDAQTYLRNGEFRLALNSLLKVEARDKNLWVYDPIVSCYRKLEMYDSVEYYAQKMFQLRPNASLSLRAMRTAKSGKKQYRTAEYFAKRVLEAKQLEEEPLTVGDYGNLAFYQLFTRDFEGALASVDSARSIDNSKNWPLVNKAHALLLLDRRVEALELYEDLKEKPNDTAGGTGKLKEGIIKDLIELEAAGISHKDFREVRRVMQR